DVKNVTTYYYLVTLMTDQEEYDTFPDISATPVVALNTPEELKAVAGNGEVEISWDHVDSATSYDIKRSIEGDTYEVIGNVTDTEYKDYEVENDTPYHYIIIAKNDVTSSEESDSVTVTPTDTSPIITLEQQSTSYVNQDTYTVSGTVDREATILINEQEIDLQSDLSFSSEVTLDIGENVVSITAIDENNEQTTSDINVIYDNEQPVVNLDAIDGEFDLTDDLTFDTSIDHDSEEVNHISITGVDLAGNESDTVDIRVMPAKGAVPTGPIEIIKSTIKEPNMIEVTFNGLIENLDP